MSRINVRLLEYWKELDAEQPADAPPPYQAKVIAQFSSLRIDLPPGTPAARASHIARTAANAVRAIGHRFIEIDVVNYEGEIFVIISNLNPRMPRAQAVEVVERVVRRIA